MVLLLHEADGTAVLLILTVNAVLVLVMDYTGGDWLFVTAAGR